MNKSNFSTFLVTIITLSVIALGWFERNEYWYSPKNGIGYAFGIIGLSMMLLLLLYPARKYWKPMRRLFKVHHWFKFHMIFGVWGPVLILLHCNFNLGSVNSNVALFSMLIVAGSGLLGRFVYQKLHRGLYGEQIKFTDLDSEYQLAKNNFANSSLYDEQLKYLFSNIESSLLKRKVSISTSILARRRIKKLQKTLTKSLKLQSTASNDDTNSVEEIKKGLTALKKMAANTLYTRLFSLWHLFHLPLFFMMIITAVVHIYVVHMY